MPTGRVKWFNNTKGYGFILPDECGEDHFAHYSAIKMGCYRSLKAGQDVQFDVQEGEKGQHAINIGRWNQNLMFLKISHQMITSSNFG